MEPRLELIPERDVTVLRDPTDVWLLKPNEDGTYKRYEQWEKMRRFKAKAVCHISEEDVFYLKNPEDPFGVRVDDTDYPLDADDELNLAPERPGERYRVGIDETVYDIARKFKLSPTKLMDHNDIADAKTVRPGQWLYVPKHTNKERQHIEYKVLKDKDGKVKPRLMHVTLPGGTTKFTFGNVRKWGDIRKDNKPFPDGYNTEIVAIARVPVEGMTAAYYMDKHDLGDYEKNGRVAYTRGFNWQHLADGHINPPVPTATHEQVAADAMLEDDRPKVIQAADIPATAIVEAVAQPKPVVIEAVAEEPPEAPVASYKDTFRYLNVEESPERFKLLQDLDIRDMDGEQPSIRRKADSSVMISGWFTHEGTPYYRVATRHWYAIPAQFAYSVEDEPFNGIQLSLQDKLAYGATLTPEERRMVLIAKTAARYRKTIGVSKKLIRQFRHNK